MPILLIYLIFLTVLLLTLLTFYLQSLAPLYFLYSFIILFLLKPLDTGAFSSAMPISIFNKIKRFCPKSITNYNPQPSTVKVATGASITTHGTFQAFFEIAKEIFTETFILMETKNQTILGLPFSEKHDILIHPKTRNLKLPNMTIQLTERVHKDNQIFPKKSPVFFPQSPSLKER